MKVIWTDGYSDDRLIVDGLTFMQAEKVATELNSNKPLRSCGSCEEYKAVDERYEVGKYARDRMMGEHY